MEKSTHTAEYLALRAELRAAREAAALSQRALAQRLRVPHSWVAKVESGERRIDVVELSWFLAACGSDPVSVAGRLLQSFGGKRTARNSKGGRNK
jgi:transcriptional regulator with XRE-family HTH domain